MTWLLLAQDIDVAIQETAAVHVTNSYWGGETCNRRTCCFTKEDESSARKIHIYHFYV